MAKRNNTSSLTFPEIVAQYNALLEEARKLDFFVRDTELQNEIADKLQEFLHMVKGFKSQARDQKNENVANTFFHFQCILNATICSMKMWVSLKKPDYHSAWNFLVEAQEYVGYARRISERSYGIDDFKERLERIESTIFAGFPLYNSLGIVTKGGKCSICGNRLEVCSHIEDEIYFGSVCRRVDIEDFEINHSAIVAKPKDRRCIITEFEFSPGKIYDYITLRYLKEKPKTKKDEGTYAKMVMFNMNELDLD